MALKHNQWQANKTTQAWSRLLANYSEAATASLHALPDALPTVEVAGVGVPINKYSEVSLIALAQV